MLQRLRVLRREVVAKTRMGSRLGNLRGGFDGPLKVHEMQYFPSLN